MFKFNNLRLALGTNLKFYTSVAKGLKLKVRKFWGLIPTFAKVTEERLVRSPFLSSPSIFNRVKAVVDEGELATDNNRKKKSEVLQVHRYPLCDKCYRSDWGNHDFPCGYILCGLVLNKLKGRKLCPYLMNRNHLEITLVRRDSNCCTMENLKYLLCSKWTILTGHVE